MRKYIRHPINIPIEVTELTGRASDDTFESMNLSIGGLGFRSNKAIKDGKKVKIRIDYIESTFEAEARVVWCREGRGFSEIGVEFTNLQDAFAARMVEQIIYIGNYKDEIYKKEGRVISFEEAAGEWISKFAAKF